MIRVPMAAPREFELQRDSALDERRGITHLHCCSATQVIVLRPYTVARPPRPPSRSPEEMPPFNGHNFQDRQSEAANARKAQLEKFRSRPDPNDPAILEKQAQRRAVIQARKAREAERERQRKIREAEEAARKAAEETARQEQLRLEAELQEQLRLEEIARKEALEAEKKAERDARYAARKERKLQRKSEIRRYR
ncbi:MAG: DUF6481 family protein [Beijerinckiaceae bacterium]